VKQVDVAATTVIGTSWAVWALAWLVSGFRTASKGPRTRTRRTYVSATLVGFVVVMVAGSLVPRRYWHMLVVSQPWLRIVGMVVLVASLAFTLWSRRVLGLMWSSAPKLKSGHELHTDGPYAITRHPIYTGMLGMFLGRRWLTGWGSTHSCSPWGS
jgi:protein-S-isoprenylcysteine O-methyltransferase Ste14